MKNIQETKNAIEACLAIEASERISIESDVSYGDLFTHGELNPKHGNFPLPGFSTLTPAKAKEKIISIYKTYSERGFFARLWWRIT